MKTILVYFFSIVFCYQAISQEIKYLPVPNNLVTEGIPQINAEIVKETKPYTEFRSASLLTVHPKNNQVFISTRFGNTAQIHQVSMPMGDRKQLTFFDESPKEMVIEPVNGSYFLFTKDNGGNEFGQLYKFDFESRKTIQLTNDPKSQNGNCIFNSLGNKIIFTSTARNGADRDICGLDMRSGAKKNIIDNRGGGWSIADWSDDEQSILINEGISVSQTNIWLCDYSKGTKTIFKSDSNVVYTALQFSNDKKSAYILTNKNSEYAYPALINLISKKITPLLNQLKWDVNSYEINHNETKAAFVVNENGISKLYVQDLKTKIYNPIPQIPIGTIGKIQWCADNNTLAVSIGTYNSGNDVYKFNTITNKLTRWTESELGGMNLNGIESPQLVQWKSFDSLNISGFLYSANKTFKGKRPVIINIHGGPEGQSLPNFIGRNNYYLNELGVSIIYPNVRGSVGYGKAFTNLDNNYDRENSVKDIGALIDWIGSQPNLDASRIMITGGSYGGYMTLACAFHYNDKIRCALDVVGISNFNTFLKNTESYRRDLRRVEYGDERDSSMAAFFEKISPLNHTREINKPLFIVQGKNDPRVPYTEAQQMADKIKNNGGIIWFLMANDEGHGFAKKNNQDYQFYSTIMFIENYLLN
jgi:dipeptidyl aminopeptidase/acylaminoacyl peptidase